MYTTPVSPFSQAIEFTRTPDAIELEAVNHELTKWFCSHVECQDEVRAYKHAQSTLDLLAAEDDEAATHLMLVLAQSWYRSLTGRDWTARR